MTLFSRIRAGLLASTLLVTTAIAAPSLASSSHPLPELSPRQIAGDVKVTYDSNTGAREYVAPSFDPFEDDHALAGTAQLRSANKAVTIDGAPLRGGAILDLSFYYNSGSSDPYDNRGYGDAVFLSGDYAPVTQRDSRVLECSREMGNVVYYHEDYYAPSFRHNLYRPHRYYSGFHGFGRRGFGTRGFGGGYGYGGYPYGYSSRRFGGRPHFGRGFRGGFGSHHGRRGRLLNNENQGNVPSDIDQADTNRADNQQDDTRQNDNGRRVRDGDRRRRFIDRDRGAGQGRRADVDGRRNARNVRIVPRDEGRPNPARLNEQGHRGQGVEPTPPVRPRATPRTTPRQTTPPRPTTPRRTIPRRLEQMERRSNRHTRHNSGGLVRPRIIALGPMASLFGGKTRRLSSQCAREEKLSLHIPQERLDAARFDGMTLLVLDRAGEELPVFIPPNYIEGFRQASAGSNIGPTYNSPGYPVPTAPTPYRPATPQETAQCPAGTTLQSDGTCLTSGYTGYPTR